MNTSLSLVWRCRVAALALVVPPLVHRVAIHRVVERLGTRKRSYRNPPVPELTVEVERWLQRLPGIWRMTCLKRAVVLFALLRRSGINVELHIGVKRDDAGALAAHAWLVRDGHTYLEPSDSMPATFQVITRFPEPVGAHT